MRRQEAVPAPALRLHREPRAPRPLLHLPPPTCVAATPAPVPAARDASAAPLPLPAGHGRRGSGAARSLRQLLRPWPATLRIALERRPRPGGAERSGAQRERPRCAPGVAGRQRASRSASLLSHPQGQVSAPRTPGRRPALRAWAGAAPGRPGHGTVTCRAVIPASARDRPQRSGNATRDPPGAGAPGALLP